MLHTERMVKLTIVGPKSKMEDIIQSCYALKVYHIVDHKKSAELDIGSPLPKAEQLSEILLKIRGLIAQLGIIPNGKITRIRQTPQQDFFALGQKARTLYEKVSSLLAQRKEYEEQLALHQTQQQLLTMLAALNLDPQDLPGTKRFAMLFGTIPPTPALQKALAKVTPQLELLESPRTALNGNRAIALIVPREHESAMRQQLSAFGFADLDCSKLAGITAPTQHALAGVQQRIAQLQRAIAKYTAELGELRRSSEDFLLLNEFLLAEDIRKAEAPLKFGTTKAGFLITGWVPERRLQETIKALNEATKETIHIETSPVHHEQEVPIAFHNPKPARPFQFFLELFALPNYHEFDPTVLMLFTFPIFFGIMLGDVGYGLLSLLLFLALKPKMPKSAKPLLNIMLYAAVLSIVFGFAFGEYLGFEHVSEATGERLCGYGLCLPQQTLELHGETETVYDFPRLLNRAHGELYVFGRGIPAVLVIGALIGVLHLNLGILLGFLNAWHHHGISHALKEKAGWWLLQGGVVLLVIGYSLLGILLVLAAAALLFLGEGVQGIIEMPALFSNALSYMRLGAVGLASVGLAIVINENFFLPLVAKGGISVLFGIIIMVVGHAINLLLGIIGPFLHSLRLHYVEFFTKFYKGGGVPYQPFGMEEVE